MMRVWLFLTLLVPIWASPTKQSKLSVFNDNTIPVDDDFNFDTFNLTEFTRDVVEKRALSLSYVLYDITFDGRNQGNFQNFIVSGQMIIIQKISSPGTRNGANPVDVAISIGKPSVNPIAGSIRYVTNRYLNPYIGGQRDTSQLDYAFVSTTSSAVRVSVDTSLAAANQISVFNARSGPLVDVYNPATGGFSLALGNSGQVSGSINVAGRSLISGAGAPYRAIISGMARQRGTTIL